MKSSMDFPFSLTGFQISFQLRQISEMSQKKPKQRGNIDIHFCLGHFHQELHSGSGLHEDRPTGVLLFLPTVASSRSIGGLSRGGIALVHCSTILFKSMCCSEWSPSALRRSQNHSEQFRSWFESDRMIHDRRNMRRSGGDRENGIGVFSSRNVLENIFDDSLLVFRPHFQVFVLVRKIHVAMNIFFSDKEIVVSRHYIAGSDTADQFVVRSDEETSLDITQIITTRVIIIRVLVTDRSSVQVMRVTSGRSTDSPLGWFGTIVRSGFQVFTHRRTAASTMMTCRERTLETVMREMNDLKRKKRMGEEKERKRKGNEKEQLDQQEMENIQKRVLIYLPRS
jgi:hypothetical protein